MPWWTTNRLFIWPCRDRGPPIAENKSTTHRTHRMHRPWPWLWLWLWLWASEFEQAQSDDKYGEIEPALSKSLNWKCVTKVSTFLSCFQTQSQTKNIWVRRGSSDLRHMADSLPHQMTHNLQDFCISVRSALGFWAQCLTHGGWGAKSADRSSSRGVRENVWAVLNVWVLPALPSIRGTSSFCSCGLPLGKQTVCADVTWHTCRVMA